MGLSYRYVPEHSAVVMQATGTLSLDDILGTLSAIAADPSVSDEHFTLFDATGVVDLTLSGEEVEKIVSFSMERSDRLIAKKLAIVTRGSKETELAQKYEKLAASMKENTIVFYHRDLACQWLGIPDDLID